MIEEDIQERELDGIIQPERASECTTSASPDYYYYLCMYGVVYCVYGVVCA